MSKTYKKFRRDSAPDYRNYDRAYVKSLKGIKHLSFSKCCRPSWWDYTNKNKKIYNYIDKICYMFVEKPFNEFAKKVKSVIKNLNNNLYEDIILYYKEEYFELDENEIILSVKDKTWYRIKRKNKNTISFFIFELKHNDEEYKKLKWWHVKAYDTCKKYHEDSLLPMARGMKYVGKYYVPYKKEILLLDVVFCPNNLYYRYNGRQDKFKSLINIGAIYGMSDYPLKFFHPYYEEYTEIKNIYKNGEKVDEIKTKKYGNFGYGDFSHRLFIFKNQAEAQLEIKKFKATH